MAKTVKRLIWTIGNRPFVMGGSVHYPLGCKVPTTGPFDLGNGYKGYLATSPNGKTFVAESKTGAIVGSTLAQVRKDVEKAKHTIMRKQVAEAALLVPKIELKSAHFFWSALNGNG